MNDNVHSVEQCRQSPMLHLKHARIMASLQDYNRGLGTSSTLNTTPL